MIDFDRIQLKSADNFNALYKVHVVKEETISFLQEYSNLIYEKDFQALFQYHSEKARKEILDRIVAYYKNTGRDSSKLSVEHILQQILNSDVNEKNYDVWLKNQCIAIIKTFDILTERINKAIECTPEEKLFHSDFISANSMHLRKLIIDAKELLMYMEAYKGDTPKEQIGFNRGIQGFDSNWYADLLFNGTVDYSNFAYYIDLAFLLRDSIELRVRKGLGIFEVTLPNGSSAHIANDLFLDFVFENNNIELPTLNKAVIQKIFKWSNFHIHKGFVLYEWQLVLSYDYVQPLFKGVKNSQQINLYGAIKIQEQYYKNQLANDLENYLFAKDSKNKGIKVILMDKPEAMLIK